MQSRKNILVCPLNWGLGHATRDVPIIRQLLHQGHHVIIGASGNVQAFLKQEFPDVAHVNFPGYTIRYAKKPFFLLFLLLQMPLFFVSIFIEHQRVKQLVNIHNINQIISDNRYGLWHKKVESVLITHQIFIRLPQGLKPFSGWVHAITRKLILKFNKCWIPDYEDMEKSLSGKLSHGAKIPENSSYIGPLSRFQDLDTNFFSNDIPDVLAIISGPEPHRTLFENDIETHYTKTNKTLLIVCGKPGAETHTAKSNNIKKVSHLPTKALAFYLKNCAIIITRSGYSTLMDLHVLGISAQLSATPGQTEQEYLAARYAQRQQTDN